MKAWVGKSVIVIGLVHSAFGLVVLGDLLAPTIREGVFNTISAAGPPERNMAFWYLLFGFMTLMIGGLIDWVERKGAGVPAFLPWGFLALAIVGCVMMPASGFWLLSVPTAGLFLRRGGVQAEASPAELS